MRLRRIEHQTLGRAAAATAAAAARGPQQCRQSQDYGNMERGMAELHEGDSYSGDRADVNAWRVAFATSVAGPRARRRLLEGNHPRSTGRMEGFPVASLQAACR